LVAEAVPSTETEEKPPEDVAVTTPDSTPEQTPENDNQQEDTSFVDDILKGLDSSDAPTGADDGKAATTDGQVPASEKPKTEAEIRQQIEAENRQRQEADNLRLYREGVNRSFQSLDSDLSQMAKEWGLDIEQADRLKQRVQQHNGHWNVLYQAAIEQAKPQIEQQVDQRTQATVANLIYETVKGDLGDSSVKALQEAGAKDWGEFIKAVGNQYRKGYVPAADYTKKSSVKELLKRIDTAAREHGFSLDAFTGNGGTDLPPPRSGNVRTGTKEWAESAPIEQLLADRARRQGA